MQTQVQPQAGKTIRKDKVERHPLAESKAFSGFAVNDMEAAKDFYNKVLGLQLNEGEMGTANLNLAGGQNILVYPKPDHQPATFTILNFPVSDIESTVKELKAAGVQFEQYDGDVKTDEQGIFRGGGPLIAWFKDPAGNILSVMEIQE